MRAAVGSKRRRDATSGKGERCPSDLALPTLHALLSSPCPMMLCCGDDPSACRRAWAAGRRCYLLLDRASLFFDIQTLHKLGGDCLLCCVSVSFCVFRASGSLLAETGSVSEMLFLLRRRCVFLPLWGRRFLDQQAANTPGKSPFAEPAQNEERDAQHLVCQTATAPQIEATTKARWADVF